MEAQDGHMDEIAERVRRQLRRLGHNVPNHLLLEYLGTPIEAVVKVQTVEMVEQPDPRDYHHLSRDLQEEDEYEEKYDEEDFEEEEDTDIGYLQSSYGRPERKIYAGYVGVLASSIPSVIDEEDEEGEEEEGEEEIGKEGDEAYEPDHVDVRQRETSNAVDRPRPSPSRRLLSAALSHGDGSPIRIPVSEQPKPVVQKIVPGTSKLRRPLSADALRRGDTIPKTDVVRRHNALREQWNRQGVGTNSNGWSRPRKTENFAKKFAQMHATEARAQRERKKSARSSATRAHGEPGPTEKRRDHLRWSTRVKMSAPPR